MIRAADIRNFNVKAFLTTGHSRSVKAKKNIVGALLIKGISIITSFLLVPLTISYLSPLNYGIWLTLYSIISWFGLLDIGLGNGLRNRLAESLAVNDMISARMYVSTAYAMLALIMLFASVVFLIVNNFLNWPDILNVSQEKFYELRKVTMVIFGFFCAQLVVKLISAVLFADQKSALAGALNTVCSILLLATTYILYRTGTGSLLKLSLATGIINLAVPFIAGIIFFRRSYKEFSPSLTYIKFASAKKLVNVGIMFFLFQSTALIVVATDNVIISHLFGPAEVTPYNIAFKYFTPVTLFFTLVSNPMWSAYTEAYTLGDMGWIKRITKKMLGVWTFLVVGVIPMVLLSKFAYEWWVGKDIHISYTLTAFMGLYVLLASLNQVFGNFINGTGKMKLGFYLTLFTAIINIPLCIFLADTLGMGISGIIAASCISLLPDIIFIPIQYYKIVNNKATGIWNK